MLIISPDNMSFMLRSQFSTRNTMLDGYFRFVAGVTNTAAAAAASGFVYPSLFNRLFSHVHCR